MDCFDLKGDTIKILGICFSRNKKVEQKKNFLSQIVTIQNAFKLQKLRNVTIEERTAVVKSLAISNIIHFALVTETLINY